MQQTVSSKPLERKYVLELLDHNTDVYYPGVTVPFIRLPVTGTNQAFFLVSTTIISLLPRSWAAALFEVIASKADYDNWEKELYGELAKPAMELHKSFSLEGFAAVKAVLMEKVLPLLIGPLNGEAEERLKFEQELDAHFTLLSAAAANRQPIEKKVSGRVVLPAPFPKEDGVLILERDQRGLVCTNLHD